MSIISFFEALGKKVYTELCDVFGKENVDAVDAKLKVILQADVRVIFEDGVKAAQSLTDASGTQKHDAAFAQISTDLKAQGKSFGTDLINFGIELVLGLIRGTAVKV